MKTIVVRLSDEEEETLAALCYLLDSTQADIVRKGMAAIAKEVGPLPVRPRRQPNLPGVEADEKGKGIVYEQAGIPVHNGIGRLLGTTGVAPTIGASRVTSAPDRESAEAMNRADKSMMTAESRALIDRMRGGK